MPVEIRELVIRAVTTADPHRGGIEDIGENSRLSASQDHTEAIIQECVRQVLRILQKQKER